MEPLYWLAAGRSLQACIELEERQQRAHKAWADFAQKLGGTNWLAQNGRFNALLLPDGMTSMEGMRVRAETFKGTDGRPRLGLLARPDRRTTAGKVIGEEWDTLPSAPTSWDVAAALIGEIPMQGSFRVQYVRDARVIVLSGWLGNAPPEPPDAIPLKASEYWARREAAEEASCGT